MQAPPAPFKVAPSLFEGLLALAPLRLPNYRQVRYFGDNLCVALDTMVLRDQVLLRSLYEYLTELLYTIADPPATDAQRWEGVQEWINRRDLDAVIAEVREIGLATQEQGLDEKFAETVHDVRGGALSSLLGRLQLLDRLPRTAEELNVLFVLTRDHLKIMRNALVGLDEPRREADRKPKAHAMALMLAKWQESVVGPQWRERPVTMHIDCRYEGALTECCLESAAIDRIFYNLAANACRHAADERLEMVIFPIPDQAGESLRFVLSNQVNVEEAARLRAAAQTDGTKDVPLGTGQNIVTLFEPEVSSSGSGFGLTVVADFVAGAFGLRDRTEALQQRYVGAILDGQTFRVWFHWSVAHDNLPQKLDDYHQPKQSLSEP